VGLDLQNIISIRPSRLWRQRSTSVAIGNAAGVLLKDVSQLNHEGNAVGGGRGNCW